MTIKSINGDFLECNLHCLTIMGPNGACPIFSGMTMTFLTFRSFSEGRKWWKPSVNHECTSKLCVCICDIYIYIL